MVFYFSRCQSAIGRTGGSQTVMLARNCMDKRSILRELMHVLGFNDEHLRSDRDSFITVNRNNIKSSKCFTIFNDEEKLSNPACGA